jgi:peptidoglycan/xylan/chitin deacetylase (PgdA/CDA1 family)
MSLRILGLLILGIIATGGAAFATRYINIRKSMETTGTFENPTFYAEISTTSMQFFPAAIPSTKHIYFPILVYHIVRPSYPNDSQAIRTIALTPETFDAEMNYLKITGYHVVRFSDLEAYFGNDASLPQNPIIISFDDGWSDQFTYAFPILKKYNYPATFFVFTNVIGRRGFLSWDDLRQLLAAGMTVGDHTRSHPYLTSITNSAVLWDEIYGSKLLLEQQLGVPIYEFAYPFGIYNSTISALVEKAGYRSARGDYFSREQAANKLYELSAMNAPTTTALFEEKFPNR